MLKLNLERAGVSKADSERQTFQTDRTSCAKAQERTEGQQEVWWNKSQGRSGWAGGWDMMQRGGTSWLGSEFESDSRGAQLENGQTGFSQRLQRLEVLGQML